MKYLCFSIKQFCILLLLFTQTIDLSTQRFITINTTTNLFVDEFGRERIFHGCNAVNKVFPFYPGGNSGFVLGREELQKLKYLGINIIRIGLMYSGAMPARGEINETYFQELSKTIDLAWEYGIYSLLDSHQDLFTYYLGLKGDGFPEWSVIVGNARAYPLPYESTDLYWGLYYFTEIVNSAFQHFYNNTNGIQTDFVSFWKYSSTYFANYNSVIGYELINEPWPGDIYSDVLYLLPGYGDKKNLEPLYRKIGAAIRSIDPHHLIFFEGITWDNWGVGFDTVPGGDEYQNRSVLSYHIYFGTQTDVASSMEEMHKCRKRLKCGSMLTEFEMWAGPNLMYNQTVSNADTLLESWIGWNSINDMLNHQTDYWPSIARPYAQAVAGHIQLIDFQIETRNFTLSYVTNSNINSNKTIIYINAAIHYPDGYTKELFPKDYLKWTILNDPYLVQLEHSNHISNNVNVTVIIYPK